MRNLKHLGLFVQWYVKRSWSNHIALKVDGLKDRKMYCLKARPCIRQPGNFTDWGSEEVNTCPDLIPLSVQLGENYWAQRREVCSRDCPVSASSVRTALITVQGHGNDQFAFKCVIVPSGKILRSHVFGALVKLACFVFQSDLSDWLFFLFQWALM